MFKLTKHAVEGMAIEAKDCRLWPVGVHAGKDLLKDRWQIRTRAQIDAMFGDVGAELPFAAPELNVC
jgi:hypothetical protein